MRTILHCLQQLFCGQSVARMAGVGGLKIEMFQHIALQNV